MPIQTLSREIDLAEANRPYGVHVGDRVHYWQEKPPPLSPDYVAPACLPAIVIRFAWDARSVWLADLAVVDPERGELHVVSAVQQTESFASCVRADRRPGDRSYGIPASWHHNHEDDRS